MVCRRKRNLGCLLAYQRVSDVPIYATDAIVRRAVSLQKTRDAATPRALMHSVELKKLNLQSGEMIKLTQEHGSARLSVIADDSLPHALCALPRPCCNCRTGRNVWSYLWWSAHDGPTAYMQNLLGVAWLPIWTLVKILVIVVPIMLTVAYLTLAERKVIGYMQVRIGPNRVGYFGLLQPLADGLKLLLKEIIIPSGSNKFLFVNRTRPCADACFGGLAVVPFADGMVLAERQCWPALYLGDDVTWRVRHNHCGLASNSKYAFLGSCARRQIVSTNPHGFCLGMCADGLAEHEFGGHSDCWSKKQRGAVRWYSSVFPDVRVYFISGVAETNRAPLTWPK